MTPYQELLDEAMLGIVRKVLLKAQLDGIEDEQSFYISFITDHPDVVLSKHVKSKYPSEITIVLQYQFRDLRVFEDKFTVNIAFGGVPETIVVPFGAITAFVDPSANFSLQFKHSYISKEFEDLEMEDLQREFEEIFEKELTKANRHNSSSNEEVKGKTKGKVIALQQERVKKSTPKSSKLKSDEADHSKMVNDQKENKKAANKKSKSSKGDSDLGLLEKETNSKNKKEATSSKKMSKAGEVISIDKFRRKNHDS